jgi:hypothetical protein
MKGLDASEKTRQTVPKKFDPTNKNTDKIFVIFPAVAYTTP